MSESSTTPPLPSQPPRPDELEKQVAELTAWRGEETQLWKKAVETTEREGKEPWVRRFMARPMRVNAVGIAAVLLVGVFVVGLLLPSLGQARHAARQLKDGTQVRGVVGGMSTFAGKHTVGELGVASGADAEASKPGYGRGMIDLAGGVAGRGGAATSIPDEIEGAYVLNNLANAQVIIRAPGGSQSDSDRQVVRKATIELTSDDVRGTFAKAAHLASEAGGEYVENSSLTGEGKTAQGNLTLRVAATRLGALMTSLRELGVVKAENTTGEDVTAQVVDLEARVRNEQRVEQELLQLLEKRADAPLKDILELRGSLSQVRDSIERLIGQRERLSRLVSLASVLVVIRTPEQPVKPPEPPAKSGMREYFSKAVGASWRNGLEFLSDTVAAGVGLVVGGLLWWAILGLAVLGIVRWRRRLAARCV